MMHLSHQEIDVLVELDDDGGWLNSEHIAARLDLAPFTVRSSLQALRRFRLIERGNDMKTVGHFRLTDAGRRELARRQQLRMV